MPTNEKVLINYLHNTTYNNTPDNQVGTDADQVRIFGAGTEQRTVPTPTGDTAYVRKFGTALTITDLDSLSDPGVANLTWTVKTADGATTYGSRANGGAYSDGSTTATSTAIRLEASVSGATTVLPTTMNINDSVVGGLTVNLPAESVTSAEARVFYIARSGSSYYDTSLKYGGARHTPVLTSSAFPYFDIATAYGALAASNNDGVEVLDSETYDENLTSYSLPGITNQELDSADTMIYAKSGQAPTIEDGIGARTTRTATAQYNNTSAIYFNENGNDANAGTWQSPKLTIAGASAARTGTKSIVYGGSGAGGAGVFTEDYTSNYDYAFEADTGYAPTISGGISLGAGQVMSIYGFIIDGTGGKTTGININNVSTVQYIMDCTIKNFTNGITKSISAEASAERTRVYKNLIHDCTYGIYWKSGTTSASFEFRIYKNFIYSNTYGIYYECSIITVLAGGVPCYIYYNNIYSNSYGLYVTPSAHDGVSRIDFYSNTVMYNTVYGVFITGGMSTTLLTLNIADNIVYSNTTFDLIDISTTHTITESNYGTNSGFTIGAGCITTDPEICRKTIPYKFGISADSGAYRVDTNSDDMGAKLKIIELDASDIEINGVIIDGQTQNNSAIYIKDTDNVTGSIIKGCKIINTQGIAIDLYDDGTDTDATVSNNLIGENGNGLNLAYGGNTVDENAIYNNTVYGVYSDYTVNTFNHNVFYGNKTGLYFAGNSSSYIIKNCIFNNNTSYAIDSNIPGITLTYSCITDAVGTTVDTSDSSNFTANPLFINTTSGSEDFNIKTTEAGYSYNSACKDSSDSTTFPDIGAYDITRSVNTDAWKKHQFAYNPRVVEFQINSKGNTSFNSGTGTQWNWSTGRRRGFELKWQTGQYSDETDRLKVEFFNSLYQRADKERANELVKVRFNPLPTQEIDSGTSATVSATGKTITDTAKSWVEDELKGYHVGVKYDSDTGNGNLNVAKTLTVAGAGWTADEWIGYYFPYNGYYYYITDNTATVLTLSDPDDTISTVSNIDWTIEKYFKILENDDTILTVEDDDSELVAGTYDWIVRFIECHVLSPNMKYSQPRFYFQKETWKAGYNMYLEEI